MEGINLRINDIFPFPQKVTTMKDYVPYKHIRQFVQEMYHKNVPQNYKGNPKEIDHWMEVFCSKNKSKTIRRIQSMVKMEGDVPIQFFSLSGINLDDLVQVLEYDKNSFSEALKHLPNPMYFQFRVMACVYPVRRFPENTTEEEAIKILMKFMKEERPSDTRPAVINYGDLKTTWVSQTDYGSYYYEPKLSIGKHWVCCGESNQIGKVRVG